MKHNKKLAAFFFIMIFVNGFSSASAASPARIITGIFSNAVSYILKRLWSVTFAQKMVFTKRPHLNFERGYRIETIFDGSKYGIEPYSVQVGPTGELLILDSANSNMHKISFPLTRYSKLKPIAGSSRGYRGHVDGKPQESRMYNPRGFTIDDSGNIYIADTSNKAIRKISNMGVTTIAGGGKWKRRSNVDRTKEEDFSDDFDVVYISSSCSLLVVDRGKQAIREIQLPEEDCSSHHRRIIDYPLGIAVLVASAFFGYMLAVLQSKAKEVISPSEYEDLIPTNTEMDDKPHCTSSSMHQPVELLRVRNKEKDNKEINKSFISQTFGSLLLWFKRRMKTNQPATRHNEQNKWPTTQYEEPPVSLNSHKKSYVFNDGNLEKSQRVKKEENMCKSHKCNIILWLRSFTMSKIASIRRGCFCRCARSG